MERAHQCATIQLDFQLPIRFRLKYQCKRDMAPGAEGEEPAEAAKEVMEQEAEAPAGAEGDDKRTWRSGGLLLVSVCLVGLRFWMWAFTYATHTPHTTSAADHLEGGYKRPIIVHRAMLGSLERMIAVLTEHFGGKWYVRTCRRLVGVPTSRSWIV